ncbi:DoxX family protein [Marivita sp. S2033]|uniref:DoxX family protein n=1 Tax=Marivita sp. S2033 TaxID=3373187 RepID=UPI003982448E
MPDYFETPRERLFLPFLSSFYASFAQPVGWLAFRIIIGGLFMLEGWQKIQRPMAQAGFVEMIGFAPGWFFSPLLAFVNFFGGLLIVIGFLTRPAALASALVLLTTYWFHVTHPYGDAFLTQEGIAYLNENKDLLTPAGQRRLLTDGGAAFLAGPTGVQLKAEWTSLFWTAGAALIAAFGGGAFSVDRLLMRKEF